MVVIATLLNANPANFLVMMNLLQEIFYLNLLKLEYPKKLRLLLNSFGKWNLELEESSEFNPALTKSKNFLSAQDEFGISNELKLTKPHFMAQGYPSFLLPNLKTPAIVIAICVGVVFMFLMLLKVKSLPTSIKNKLTATKPSIVYSLIIVGCMSSFTKLMIYANLQMCKFGETGNSMWTLSKVMSFVITVICVVFVVFTYTVIKSGSVDMRSKFYVLFSGVR
jgi:hypothetical protein